MCYGSNCRFELPTGECSRGGLVGKDIHCACVQERMRREVLTAVQEIADDYDIDIRDALNEASEVL